MIIDENCVYIGRKFALFKETSKWHNPFVIGKDGDRDEVIEKYRAYLLTRPDLMTTIGELKGKTLICWCGGINNGVACHGDILVELADRV
jgi:hypothetical protein